MKLYKILYLIPLIAFCFVGLQAQHGEKMGERLKAYKKIMLMEKLNMSEEQSIKFFARYAEHEAMINKAKSEVDQSLKTLEQAIESGKADTESAIQSVFEKDLALKKSIVERMKAMRYILSEKQYSQYVVMEYRLLEDVKKSLLKKKK